MKKIATLCFMLMMCNVAFAAPPTARGTAKVREDASPSCPARQRGVERSVTLKLGRMNRHDACTAAKKQAAARLKTAVPPSCAGDIRSNGNCYYTN